MKIKFELKPHFSFSETEINTLLDAMAVLENATGGIPYKARAEFKEIGTFLEKAGKAHASINEFLDFVEEE